MTMPEPLPSAASNAGVALALPDGVALLPLTPVGCLTLAQAVLALMRADDSAQVAWSRAAADPAVAAWLAAAGMAENAGRPAAWISAPGRLLASLRTALATGPTHRPPRRRIEAELLLEAVAAAEDHLALVTRFDERVAESRLEALRELAYGAGHEINNPLANIAARAQALLLDEGDLERRRRLATIVDQAFRARDMIGGLMLYARPPKPEPAATTAEELLRPIVDSLASRAAARGIRLEYSPAPTPLPLYVDATQVGEAVRLLAVNAIEAVADGGRVLLEAGGDETTGRARILIADDGPGMDPDTAARAGDPFYSGREAGRGIGLGLPKARRLIESSGGSLAIDSRPGRGTRCTIDLPGTAMAAASAA
jgi:signal transduction histidine kinase